LIISAVTKHTKREGNEMSRNWHSQGSKKLHQARISPELRRFIRTLAIFEIHRSVLSPSKQSDVCQQEQRDHSWLSFDSGSRGEI